jgi:hypothetical protein
MSNVTETIVPTVAPCPTWCTRTHEPDEITTQHSGDPIQTRVSLEPLRLSSVTDHTGDYPAAISLGDDWWTPEEALKVAREFSDAIEALVARIS